MANHQVTYTITAFGARWRCQILVDGYPVNKNHFYHMRDAEMWCRQQVEILRTQLAEGGGDE